jgi:hypothetical protein
MTSKDPIQLDYQPPRAPGPVGNVPLGVQGLLGFIFFGVLGFASLVVAGNVSLVVGAIVFLAGGAVMSIFMIKRLRWRGFLPGMLIGLGVAALLFGVCAALILTSGIH